MVELFGAADRSISKCSYEDGVWHRNQGKQQILLARHRAITELLPKDMSPVWSAEKAEVLSLVGVEEAANGYRDREDRSSKSQSCLSVDLRSIDTSQSQSCCCVDSRSSDTFQGLETEFSFHPPKKASVDIPTDADGLAENLNAYRLWHPKKMESEAMSAEEWQERWVKLRERL